MLDISRNGGVPVLRCCCGLCNNACDVRPADALAAGVEPPSHTHTLAPWFVLCTATVELGLELIQYHQPSDPGVLWLAIFRGLRPQIIKPPGSCPAMLKIRRLLPFLPGILALLNTIIFVNGTVHLSFSTPKTFNGRCKKRILRHPDETARQNTRAGRYCAPPTLIPINTNLGPQHRHSPSRTMWNMKPFHRFARNRPVRRVKRPPPIDWQRLWMTPTCVINRKWRQ